MYKADDRRYDTMPYRRSGESGLLLPAVWLGLWQNFGDSADAKTSTQILCTAFDSGVTYFDLANNYGPPFGSAESNFGKIFADNFRPYRDEIIIATKAGYDMWAGPYGNWGSRKYLVASCDQSLKRMGLEYVDIFYSHRYDPQTPLEETMGTLDYIVRSGRALYAALSNYPAEVFGEAIGILKKLGTPCIAHQIKYSMLVREWGDTLFGLHRELGIGCVSFSPLAQGLLSDKYLGGQPSHRSSLKQEFIDSNLARVGRLNEIAQNRNQTLSQMAISWQLRNDNVTSVLVGVSSLAQLKENLTATENTTFSDQEERAIKEVLI